MQLFKKALCETPSKCKNFARVKNEQNNCTQKVLNKL